MGIRRKYTKKVLCMLCSVLLALSDAEISVSAEEMAAEVSTEEIPDGKMTETESIEEPITESESTQEPTTETESTQEPVTESESTQETVTENESTQETVTESESTQEPTTETESMEETLTETESTEETFQETEPEEETLSASEMTMEDAEENNVIAEGKYENITWNIDGNGKLSVTGTGEFSGTIGYKRSPWHEYCEEIKTAEVDAAGITDASYMFWECSNLSSVDMTKFDTSEVIDMSSMFYKCSNLEKIDGLGSFDTSNVKDMGRMFQDCIALPELDLSRLNTGNVTGMYWMFAACKNLEELDLSSFDTSNVTNMSYMFAECKDLSKVNLSSFDTSNVENMFGMFQECGSLEEIDLSSFNTGAVHSMGYMFCDSGITEMNLDNFITGNVTDMALMFSHCDKLKKLRLYNFDTGNVKRMCNMFCECTSLTELDLSNFDTSSVEDMSRMFSHCENLKKLDLSSFSTGSVANMYSMFEGCKNLTELDLQKFDASNVTDMHKMFDGMTSLFKIVTPANVHADIIPKLPGGLQWMDADGRYYKELPTYSESITLTKQADAITAQGTYENIEWIIDKGGKLTVVGTGDFAEIGGEPDIPRIPWYDKRESIKSAEIRVQDMTDASDMFYGCSNLVSADLTAFDTDNVIDMNSMFYECIRLENIECLGRRGTAKTTNMSAMFWDCRSLKTLDLSRLDTSHVEDMSCMFYRCEKLEKLDLDGFNTGSVKEMSGIFSWCTSLTELDLRSFNTSNTDNMDAMFYACENLRQLDLRSFDTSKTRFMNHMFYWCKNLKELDLSGFDTSNVTDMSMMFSECTNLVRLDLSHFDTSSVERMGAMFDGCEKLPQLDLSSFDTGNVTDMSYMFFDCCGLYELNLQNFNAANVTNMEEAFHGLDSIFKIHTPLNLSVQIKLPWGKWYDENDKQFTEFPLKLTKSIELTKKTGYITVSKQKTSYQPNEKIDIHDLTVEYCDANGNKRKLDASEYQTNVDEINTSEPGAYPLIVTRCNTDGTRCAAQVMIIVKRIAEIKMKKDADFIYDGHPVDITGAVTVESDGKDITDEVRNFLTFTYTGADGKEVKEAPIYAGEYECAVTLEYNDNYYAESSEKFKFVIKKASITLTASDVSLKTGDAIPKDSDYKYEMSQPAKKDKIKLMKEPAFKCDITDTTKDGTYEIVISGAEPEENPNYEKEIKYANGTLTVTAWYTVTFNMSGKGDDVRQENIKKGSAISRPADPVADGFIFTGWYKDQAYTMQWNFATDTIESDITLYAGWRENKDDGKDDDNKDEDKDDSKGDDNKDDSGDQDDSVYTSAERRELSSAGAQIAVIKPKVYDGSAYEPVIKVTASVDGRNTTLTEGTDYRVLYRDNINAGNATVTVKGNGIYKGTLTGSFTIKAKPVSSLKIITGSVSSASQDGSLSEAVYIYGNTGRLEYGKDFTLSGYSAKASQATVTVTGNGNYTGTKTVKLTVYNNDSGKIINPGNVRLNTDSAVYTGKPIQSVEPVVTVDTITLTKNKDYKVSFQNNKNVGDAFVIVTGKGAYKGKVVIPFRITAQSVSSSMVMIKPIPAKTYNGKLQKPAVKVSVNGRKLTRNRDYTVIYKDNLHAGTATVTVIGKGNYADVRAEAKFIINPQHIKKASVRGMQGNLLLTYKKRILKQGADYEEPAYTNLVKNKVKVTITGKGDFTGQVTKSVRNGHSTNF